MTTTISAKIVKVADWSTDSYQWCLIDERDNTILAIGQPGGYSQKEKAIQAFNRIKASIPNLVVHPTLSIPDDDEDYDEDYDEDWLDENNLPDPPNWDYVRFSITDF